MMYLIVLILGVAAAVLYSSRRSALAHKSKQLRAKEFVVASKQWLASAKQDTDPVDALVHGATSAAYLSAARALLPEHELAEVISIDGLLQSIQLENRKLVKTLRHQLHQKKS